MQGELFQQTTLTSDPNPNAKIRRVSSACALASAAIAARWSGRVSPTVGSPSVTNRITGKRAANNGRAQRFAQRAFDVGAPRRVERGEIARRFADVVGRRRDEVVAEGVHVARKVDQPEPVGFVKRGEQLTPRRALALDLALFIEPETSSTRVTSRGMTSVRRPAGGVTLSSVNPSSLPGA